jgi:hypothetical protein
MRDNTYNGWTNYETWRVNLEIFDGMTLGDLWGFADASPSEVDTYELSKILKEYAEELIYESGGGNGTLAVDYALAFLSGVDWYSIAEHMTEECVCDESRSYGPHYQGGQA